MAVTRIWDADNAQWQYVGGDADVLDLDGLYLPLAGGTLSGDLILSGAPSLPNEAATKAYVDANSGVGGSVPPGVFFPYGGQVEPAGYLFCHGQAVSRTTYAGLFAAIGTLHGVGDGSTTFDLPLLRGRIPIGVTVSGTASTFAGTGGSLDHTHTGPSHIHTMGTHTHLNAHTHPGASHTHPAASGGSGIGSTGIGGGHSHSFSDTSGGPSTTNFRGADGALTSVAGNTHTHSIGGTTGSSTHLHNTPDHTHPIDTDAPTSVGTTGNASSATGAADPGDTGAAGTGVTGGGNMAFLAVHYIIKT